MAEEAIPAAPMDRLRYWMQSNTPRLWLGMVMVAILVASGVYLVVRAVNESGHAEHLKTEVDQLHRELVSYTMNGNLMGSVSLLGVIHSNIKQEALGAIEPKESMNSVVLGLVGGTYRARGVFVVGEDGLVKSSWNQDGSSSTGTDVRQRPYYQFAMRGKASVYAAVSMANKERSIYFSAPVFSEIAVGNSGIGAVVARNDMEQVEKLLKDAGGIALLLSPQGVVFAASDPRWIGSVHGPMTPTRLQDIQQRKQVSALISGKSINPLPFDLEKPVQSALGGRYVQASTPLDWGDPAGPWRLVMLDAVNSESITAGPAITAMVALILALALQWLLVRSMRSRWAQRDAAASLAFNLEQQRKLVELRDAMAAMALRLQQCANPAELGRVFLAEMHRTVGALQGVLYSEPLLPEPGDTVTGRFGLTATYATPAEVPSVVVAGSGHLGQALADGKLRWLGTSEASGAWQVTSGLGSAAAACVALCPLKFNDSLLGAVELVFINQPDPVREDLVEEAVAVLALNVAVQQRSATALSGYVSAPVPQLTQETNP